MTRLLSPRGQQFIQEPGFMMQMAYKAFSNPYEPQDNPTGIVNLGVAENSLCTDILNAKMKHELNFKPHDQFYPSDYYMKPVKQKVAHFLEIFMNSADPIDAANIGICNGVGSVLAGLANVLASPGEYFLTPAPLYTQFEHDFYDLSGVTACVVQLLDEGNQDEPTFELTADKVDHALKEAATEGKVVRAFVLSNPCNPLGDIYSEALVREVLEVCKKHCVHVIMDEIYALTIFGEGATFRSVLSFKDIPDPDRTHFVWGASKDLAMSGTRFGLHYTTNKDVATAFGSLNYFLSCPPVIVEAIANIISDTAWMRDVYLPTNVKRMRESYSFLQTSLEEMGIHVRESTASFFIWADFHKALRGKCPETEVRFFTELMAEAGVYIIPGTKLGCPLPGWFRLVFTHPVSHLRVAVERIRHQLHTYHAVIASSQKFLSAIHPNPEPLDEQQDLPKTTDSQKNES